MNPNTYHAPQRSTKTATSRSAASAYITAQTILTMLGSLASYLWPVGLHLVKPC